MYVRIFWGKLVPGTWDAYERHYLENVVPLSEQFKGFQGRQLFRSMTNPDEGMSISFWDTQEDMEKYGNDQESACHKRRISVLCWGVLGEVFRAETLHHAAVKARPQGRLANHAASP